VDYVLSGIAHSFNIGCSPQVQLTATRKNKESAYEHHEIIDAYSQNEVRLGRIAGPFETPPLPDLHISSFGVIPKLGQPGNFRFVFSTWLQH
jgi:hypothetical protein